MLKFSEILNIIIYECSQELTDLYLFEKILNIIKNRKIELFTPSGNINNINYLIYGGLAHILFIKTFLENDGFKCYS